MGMRRGEAYAQLGQTDKAKAEFHVRELILVYNLAAQVTQNGNTR
jgi:hypothetical protein